MKVTEVEKKASRKRCCGSGCRPEDTMEWESRIGALIDQRTTGNNPTRKDEPVRAVLWKAG